MDLLISGLSLMHLKKDQTSMCSNMIQTLGSSGFTVKSVYNGHSQKD